MQRYTSEIVLFSLDTKINLILFSLHMLQLIFAVFMSAKIMIEESNGNGNLLVAKSHSIDDLSQSLSEYTDAADESMSAPTEFLAEFLSAVMLKDYRKALRYCKLSM